MKDPREHDLYKALGVDSKATQDEIKKAFRRLARKYHPDRAKGDKRAEERFKEINEAHEILTDEKKRREYDMLRTGGPFGGGFNFGGGQFNFGGSAGPDFRTFTDIGGGAPGASPGGGLGGIFESLFGGAAEGRNRRPRQGQDVVTTLEIPFELAVRGGAQKITVRMTEPDAGGGLPRSTTKEVNVKIPAGIKDGQKIRLAGAGQSGPNGGPPGSLMITIKVQPHAIFTREGADIHSKVQVDLATALLGGTASVRTLDSTVNLKIPPGTQPGQKFKIRGQGGPKRDGSRDDHYATIEVRLPKELTPDQRRLFDAFVQSLR